MCIYIYIFFFHILSLYGSLQDIEYSPLCYTVGPCLSILYIVVCIKFLIYPSLPPLSSPLFSKEETAWGLALPFLEMIFYSSPVACFKGAPSPILG